MNIILPKPGLTYYHDKFGAIKVKHVDASLQQDGSVRVCISPDKFNLYVFNGSWRQIK
jgi:hypothetical protein